MYVIFIIFLGRDVRLCLDDEIDVCYFYCFLNGRGRREIIYIYTLTMKLMCVIFIIVFSMEEGDVRSCLDIKIHIRRTLILEAS